LGGTAPKRSAPVTWYADSVSQTFSLQWECLPFKPYEVQVCTNLAGSLWQAATNFPVSGNVES
jgi:hypothetical protein